jgi:hypothetical protein
MRLVIYLATLLPLRVFARDAFEVELSPVAREYCHIVQFPGWGRIQKPGNLGRTRYEYYDDYEFRTAGVGSDFMVRGRVSGVGVYGLKLDEGYTRRIYEVNFANSRAKAHSVSEQRWTSGFLLSHVQKSAATFSAMRSANILYPDQNATFHGFELERGGKNWPVLDAASRLSPDQAWLVLQSFSGGIRIGGILDDNRGEATGGPTRGQVFLDFFDANTGKRVLTIQGRYRYIDPETTFRRSGWLTERFFIVPLGAHRERCLICDFGAAQTNGKQ